MIRLDPSDFGVVDFDPFAGPQLALTTPSTESQREIWAATRMGPDASCAFNESNTLQLAGRLEVEALRAAFTDLVNRHDALRSTFTADGGTVLVASSLDLELPLYDYSALPSGARQEHVLALVAREVEQPFDLEHGPLIRASLVRLEAQEHLFVFTAHHLVCDGWSTAVLLRDLGRLYSARAHGRVASLPDASPFSEYARERAAAEATPEYVVAEEWWLSQFAGPLPSLDLPFDSSRPALKTYNSARMDSSLGTDLVAQLKRLATRSGASFFTVLLAGFDVLLHRLSGAEDLIVGVPWAGQSTSGHLEVVGHCVNTLPIRCRVDGSDSFGALVGRLRSAILDASERSDYTYGRLVSKLAIARDPSRLPLVSVLFNLDQGLGKDDLAFDDLSVSFASNPRRFENFDLFLNAVELDGNVRLECQYNTDLVEASTVLRWLALLTELLRSAAATPEAAVARLPMLPEFERAAFAAWNQTDSNYPRHAHLHDLVEQQVERSPNAVAVVSDGEQLTYADLNSRANRLARELRALGVDRNVRVGLCLERSSEMLVALLAVSKSGGAYVPLDPAYPRERLAFMVHDSGMRVVVTQDSVRSLLPASDARVLSLDGDRASILAQSDAPIEFPLDGTSSDVAYVIYTSGSTGTPKGVLVQHRAVVNLLSCTPATPGLTANDVVVAITTLSFDIAVYEVWLPLTVGARIVVAPREAAGDGALLLGLLGRVQATVLQATPATWRLLIDAGWEGGDHLKVISTGEALPRALARELVERSDDVWNMYGPTETTVWSSHYRLPPTVEAVLIGRPMANTQLHVLDEHLQMVPIGVPGELYIGGDGVTLGYLDRPELTAQRFVADPFRNDTGARLYRTGDLVRWHPDGTLEYLGRNDHQVKVRGFRIELGEIEATLVRHASVAQAVASAREDRPGDVRLVAYVVPRPGSVLVEDELRELLRGLMPEYMQPQHLIQLQALPLTLNGKVDRAALPAPDVSTPLDAEYIAPRGELEQFLAEVWQDVLGIGRIGVHDDFFMLGGHSLLAARVMSRLARDRGISVPLRMLFEAPTIARFAPLLAGVRKAIRIPARTGFGPASASIMQRRITLLEQIGSGLRTFNLPAAWRLRGALDVAALQYAINTFIQHQDATRTTLRWYGTSVVQTIQPHLELDLSPVDLRALPSATRQSELMRRMLAASDVPFDLATGPLIRVQLFRLADDEHVLFLLVHHAIWDGWSFDIFVREVDALYRAHRRGETVQPPELHIKYTDFAEWHNTWLESPEIEDQVKYWHEHLAGNLVPLDLPSDRPRPRVLSDAGATEWIEISRTETQALTALARRQGVTPFVLLLAAYETMLYRYSGQTELLVGTPVRGRSQPELEDVVGFFVNTVVLRAKFEHDQSFSGYLQRARATVLDALSHQDVPFEYLLMNRNPAYRAFFSFQDARNRPVALGDVALKQLHVLPEAAANDISLWIMENESGLIGGLNYSTDLFDRRTMQQFLAGFRTLLRSIVDDPARPISALPIMSEAERAIAAIGVETAGPAALVHAAFEANVDRHGSNVALIDGTKSLSYAELDGQANAVAQRLRAAGVAASTPVAVYASGAARTIGLLGIAKAGGSAVVLDPTQPEAWLARIVDDAGPLVALAESGRDDALKGRRAKIVLLDGTVSHDRLASASSVDDVALVAYTTGPDAEPLGVKLTHATISRALDAVAACTGLTATDRFAAMAPAASGRSFLETYLPFTTGAALITPDADVASDGSLLRGLLAASGATALHADLRTWRLLLEAGWSGGDKFLGLVSGEPVPVAFAHNMLARVGRAFSLYGLAETGYWCGQTRLSAGAEWVGRYVALGAPLAGVRWHLVDSWLEPVPTGVAGELVVGGVSLASGYVGVRESVAGRFTHASAWLGEGPLFRTGDFARVRGDGSVEYLARLDAGFSARGLRVEPAVVERALEQHPAVREAAVGLVRDGDESRLMAWIVARPAEDYTESELRGWLRKRLPDAMIPRRYVEVDSLPRRADGHVDRNQLPQPQRPTAGPRKAEPRTEAERLLADVWQEALGITEVGLADNFFDLGGHSLLCLQVIARIETRAGRRLNPRLLLLNTLEQVAAQLAGSTAPDGASGNP